MRAHDEFTVYVLELLTPLGPVVARRMFGGVGLFLNGLMFGLIAREELYFKVGDGNRAAYEAAGESPFSYETKNGSNTIPSYWRCPPELLDDRETFVDWARKAVTAALAVASSKGKPARKKRSEHATRRARRP